MDASRHDRGEVMEVSELFTQGTYLLAHPEHDLEYIRSRYPTEHAHALVTANKHTPKTTVLTDSFTVGELNRSDLSDRSKPFAQNGKPLVGDYYSGTRAAIEVAYI